MSKFKITYQTDWSGEFSLAGYENLLKRQQAGKIFNVELGCEVDGGVVATWSKNENCLVSDTCLEGAMHKMESGFALASSLTKWTKLSSEVISA